MSYDNKSLFELYFEYVKDTEPPLIYHRWSLIAGVGAFLGRQFWMPFGTNRIFPTQYVMLIGNPGTRKDTAIRVTKRLLSTAGYDKFAAEKTSKEKFLLDLEGSPDDYVERAVYGREESSRRTISSRDVLKNLDLGGDSENHDGIPREVLVVAGEFNEFAGSGNLDFLSMLGVLWDWDDENATYKHRLKNSKSVSIYQPTVSILSGNTPVGFQAAFPAAAMGQGFLSRLILVYSEPSGVKITFPGKPSEQLAVAIAERLHKIRETVRGESTMSVKAGQALDVIYRTREDLEDYRFKSYSTRRQTHLFKLCLIMTAMRASTETTVEDVVLANTILAWTEGSMEKALGEYGKSRNAEAVQTIMSALYSTTKPLSFEDIFKLVRRDIEKRELLPDILSGLQQAGKIQIDKQTGTFLPKQKPMDSKAVYVDFKLLKEYGL